MKWDQSNLGKCQNCKPIFEETQSCNSWTPAEIQGKAQIYGHAVVLCPCFWLNNYGRIFLVTPLNVLPFSAFALSWANFFIKDVAKAQICIYLPHALLKLFGKCVAPESEGLRQGLRVPGSMIYIMGGKTLRVRQSRSWIWYQTASAAL